MEEFAGSNLVSLETVVLSLILDQLRRWFCCLHREICDVGHHRGGVCHYTVHVYVLYIEFLCIFHFCPNVLIFLLYQFVNFLCEPVTSNL